MVYFSFVYIVLHVTYHLYILDTSLHDDNQQWNHVISSENWEGYFVWKIALSDISTEFRFQCNLEELNTILYEMLSLDNLFPQVLLKKLLEIAKISPRYTRQKQLVSHKSHPWRYNVCNQHPPLLFFSLKKCDREYLNFQNCLLNRQF
jgi:hypothetical protein